MKFLILLNILVFVTAELTQDEKDAVLAAHNDYRKQTADGLTCDKNGVAQPKASDMATMVSEFVTNV